MKPLTKRYAMIQVSEGVGDCTELEAFINDVLSREKLMDWPVRIWECRGEGLCDTTICFGLCTTARRTKALFLHEVAHAILNPERSSRAKDWHPHSYWHKIVWKEEFKRLCKTYHITLRATDRMSHYLQEGDR